MHATGIAILAAGASRRLGEPKQLVTLGGAPLIRSVAALAVSLDCEAVAAVLGYEAERVAQALGGLACERLDNPDWSEGIASSIRVAAHWAQARELDALMLLACDQVRLTSRQLRKLWAAWSTHPQAPAGSAYARTLGIPAVFPRCCYTALLALQGDRGAAKLLQARATTQVPWPDGTCDLDTPQDLLAARRAVAKP